ncbi:MAG: M61 family metallopeptidase [Leptospiraceae bacterium]|nr:M61 family metallopeptidase [Leptospiraceae bacterium]
MHGKTRKSKSNPLLHYIVKCPNPASHLFEITLKVTEERDFFIFQLPNWTPGSYTLRDYSSHIHRLKAIIDNDEIPLEHLSLDSFRVYSNHKPFQIEYTVYAFEFSVRTNYLSSEYGFINPCGFFFYPHNELNRKVKIEFHTEKIFPAVYSGLKKEKNFSFIANTFDELYDSPFQLSHKKPSSFIAGACKHQLLIEGEIPDSKKKEVLQDLKIICEYETELMGENPNKEYLFILHLRPDAYGGLEHSNSSVNAYSPYKLFKKEDYNRLLGLLAHEYFHLWNIKRIRPIELGPFDYQSPNLTENLWIAEGITSFFDNFIIMKCGFLSPEDYLKEIYSDIERLENSGEDWMSLSESSFTAWNKFYKQQANSHNTGISYYVKGAILSLCMDIRIRKESRSQIDLSTVMKAIYKEYYLKYNRGFTRDEFFKTARSVTGINLQREFENYITKKIPIPVYNYLEYIGVGIKEEDKKLDLSFTLQDEKEKLLIQKTFLKKLDKADLYAGDELLAINGYRLRSASDLDKIKPILEAEEQKELYLLLSRNDKIREVKIKTQYKKTKNLCLLQELSLGSKRLQEAFFKQWTG